MVTETYTLSAKDADAIVCYFDITAWKAYHGEGCTCEPDEVTNSVTEHDKLCGGCDDNHKDG